MCRHCQNLVDELELVDLELKGVNLYFSSGSAGAGCVQFLTIESRGKNFVLVRNTLKKAEGMLSDSDELTRILLPIPA